MHREAILDDGALVEAHSRGLPCLANRKQRGKPGPVPIDRPAPHQTGPRTCQVPGYLREVYAWAYLTPAFARVLDRQPVVEAILWGNARRLVARVVSEMQPGWRVLQPAAVYGTFSRQLAAVLGPNGSLTVSDIAPLQVELARDKLADLPQARADLCDAAKPTRGPYDAVTCFFLLHEVPEDMKTRIVQALLGVVRPGGKVVFVDYHRPHPAHPLRPVMQLVFAWLEPFARTLWTRSVADYARSLTTQFDWRKETVFGGLYQIVVATRREA
jgi:ubiquinone/menaquinone biosynthesis C-methylase UbiE